MVTPIYPRVIEDILLSGEFLRRGMYVDVFSLSMVNSDFILSKRARDQVIYCPLQV
jgi:hypothetical protein